MGRIFQFGWNSLLLAATTLVSIQIPYLVTARFVHGAQFTVSSSASLWQNLITLLFVADIFINLRTPVFDRGRLIADKRELLRRYLSGPIALDLVAAIPYNVVLGWTGADAGALIDLVMLARLAKLPRIASWFRHNSSINYSVLRLAAFIYVMAVTSHFVACGWYALTVAPGALELTDNYVTSLYWTITTLTTIGYGDITPDLSSNLQKIYAMGVMILGVAVYGYIIGNIASLFANLDRAKSVHAEKVAAVHDFMAGHRVPSALQARVKLYFSYVWDANRGQQYQSMLSDLPENLQYELALFLNRDILGKVPLFEGADEHAVRDLARSLEACFFLPGDRVVRHGEVGARMYFISKGSLDVVSRHGRVLTTLGEGGFFGEISLLEASPRTADVVARDFCELYALDKAAFDAIMERHEAFRRGVRERAASILERVGDSPTGSLLPPDGE